MKIAKEDNLIKNAETKEEKSGKKNQKNHP
jgi:hypothetical protein